MSNFQGLDVGAGGWSPDDLTPLPGDDGTTMMPPPNCPGRSATRLSSSAVAAAAAGCPSRSRCPRPLGKGSVN